ncbi:MAG: hypothetical protein WBO24_15480 [Nitrospirales bacterium]
MSHPKGSLEKKTGLANQITALPESLDWKVFEQKLREGQPRLEETLKRIEESQQVPQELLNLEVSV